MKNTVENTVEMCLGDSKLDRNEEENASHV